MNDEPALGLQFEVPLAQEPSDPTVTECIRALVENEPFAVLCTQGEGQPYGSVVAFAFDQDLKSFVFATPRATRKYRLLSRCDRVALVVDNRGRFPEDLMKVGAVTITGIAQQLDPGPVFGDWAGLLTARHPLRTWSADALEDWRDVVLVRQPWYLPASIEPDEVDEYVEIDPTGHPAFRLAWLDRET